MDNFHRKYIKLMAPMMEYQTLWIQRTWWLQNKFKVDLPATAYNPFIDAFSCTKIELQKIYFNAEYLQVMFISAAHLRYYLWIHNQSVVTL